MEADAASPIKQLIAQLEKANSVLVTATGNPDIDQLSATFAMSQILNEMEKHVTTLISRPIPEKLEFLKGELEVTDNVDNLRDFVISLDKRLADHLHYKVVDEEVRVYITPYRTSIGAKDIRFGQGGFNVDAVIILGATELDQLEDVISDDAGVINTAPVTILTKGDIPSAIRGDNWHNPSISSLSEMVANFALNVPDQTVLTQASSQALLTGLITATKHFSNDKTTPQVMNIAAQMMSYGANQQTIVSRLGTANSIEELGPRMDEVTPLRINKDTTSSDDSISLLDKDKDDIVPLAEQGKSKNDHELTLDHSVSSPKSADSDKKRQDKSEELSDLRHSKSNSIEQPIEKIDPLPPAKESLVDNEKKQEKLSEVLDLPTEPLDEDMLGSDDKLKINEPPRAVEAEPLTPAPLPNVKQKQEVVPTDAAIANSVAPPPASSPVAPTTPDLPPVQLPPQQPPAPVVPPPPLPPVNPLQQPNVLPPIPVIAPATPVVQPPSPPVAPVTNNPVVKLPPIPPAPVAPASVAVADDKPKVSHSFPTDNKPKVDLAALQDEVTQSTPPLTQPFSPVATPELTSNDPDDQLRQATQALNQSLSVDAAPQIPLPPQT
jgi:nanoRNase/pAp phosphatase (c-di-AMP/oligoRNAs hydrolase)